MNYELAKKLKDGGFPQKGPVGFWRLTDGKVLENGVHAFVVMNDVEEQISKPTLSELIEACGKEFAALYKTMDGWDAEAYIVGLDRFSGSTPEIAVANLWLALNTK